jgi:hypothetical protein
MPEILSSEITKLVNTEVYVMLNNYIEYFNYKIHDPI